MWLATGGRRTAVRAVGRHRLAALGRRRRSSLVALLWVVVVVAGYRMLLPARHLARPARARRRSSSPCSSRPSRRPRSYVGRLALAQRDLIAGVFADDGESATVVDTPDPFGDQERVNVLLLGGDGGEGRDGVRTDTVIVASIDTETGDTTLFSLPRNLEDLPFPADSPLAEVYPDGFDAGDESESLLNAVYRNGPARVPRHPRARPTTRARTSSSSASARRSA